jgi:flagellar biosynthetic protein FliP
MAVILSMASDALCAQGIPVPNISFGVKNVTNPDDVVGVLQVVFLLTILALAPSILIMVTSFTRIIVVLGFLRQALGTQQMPPMQVLTALAIFLTFFIMTPPLDRINEQALVPVPERNPALSQALKNAEAP